ncbi:hypothetical protein M3Y99_01837300 [Aphelenchoides fujianensis]|nr:hypothetical protein M3Y99_01837300 [Aphelenchoides fujianensis]
MGATESTPVGPRAFSPRTRERNAARNEAIATLFDSDAPSVVVPTNCAIRIFSMLDREDLESARLVCRVWNHVIDYVGRAQMQTRPIDVLELSTHREFTIKADAGDRVQTIAFKKYFADNDITGIEKRKIVRKTPVPATGANAAHPPMPPPRPRRVEPDEEDEDESEDEEADEAEPMEAQPPPVPRVRARQPQIPANWISPLRRPKAAAVWPPVAGAGANRSLVIPPYKYPCHHRFRGHLPRIDPLFRFVSDHRESVYEKVCAGRTPHEIYRQRNAYSSKLFTPPLVFYERLEWLVRDATVKHLVFINFTFTDLFVEKLEEFLGLGFPVERVFVHNCSLKYLFGQFFFEHVRNTLPAHFGSGLFETPAFLSATTIMIDGVFSRHGRIRRREEQAARSDFLGISHVRQSEEEVVREYGVEFRRADGAPHFFRHVVFGQRSFVGNALADVQRME